MIRLTITTNIPSRSVHGNFIWFPFEVDLPSIEAVHAKLNEDGNLYGLRLTTDYDKDSGRREVTARTPHVIGRPAIGMIAPCHFEYFERDEAAA